MRITAISSTIDIVHLPGNESNRSRLFKVLRIVTERQGVTYENVISPRNEVQVRAGADGRPAGEPRRRRRPGHGAHIKRARRTCYGVVAQEIKAYARQIIPRLRVADESASTREDMIQRNGGVGAAGRRASGNDIRTVTGRHIASDGEAYIGDIMVIRRMGSGLIVSR